LFEIVIKQTIGKLPEIELSIVEIERAAIKNNFGILPLSVNAIGLYRDVPLIKDHQDPFDRTLMAVAMEIHFPIMTNDAKFTQYQHIVQLWQ
jgi:PIN domain nuclease of toxin-antitoxin system